MVPRLLSVVSPGGDGPLLSATDPTLHAVESNGTTPAATCWPPRRSLVRHPPVRRVCAIGSGLRGSSSMKIVLQSAGRESPARLEVRSLRRAGYCRLSDRRRGVGVYAKSRSDVRARCGISMLACVNPSDFRAIGAMSFDTRCRSGSPSGPAIGQSVVRGPPMPTITVVSASGARAMRTRSRARKYGCAGGSRCRCP